MKIMIIISSLKVTGPGNVVQSLANQFVKENEVTLLVLSEHIGDNIDIHSNINVINLGLDKGSIKKGAIKKINELIEDLKIDVVFSHGLRSDFLNSKLNPKNMVLKISTSHNNPFEDYPSDYGIIKGFLMAVVQMKAFRKMDKVITLNPSLEKLHKLFLGKNKVTTIVNGVPIVDVQRKNSGKIFGSVATFNSRKNQELMINAFLENNFENAILWGTGPNFKEISLRVKNTNIKLPGFSKNKEKIFGSFDIFISTSRSEGMPLSVLEAISCGMPLILSDIPAHRFIVHFLPQNCAFLFKNEKELKIIMKKIMSESINIQNINNKMKIAFKNYFTEEKMANNYIKLINEQNMLKK